MTAPDFTDAERYRLAFIERAAPAPESFDATAALQRVEALCAAWEQQVAEPRPLMDWQVASKAQQRRMQSVVRDLREAIEGP